MQTVGELIDRFGGPASFARLLGKGISTATEMKRRQSIHVRYWPTIIQAATARGIDLDAEKLMRLHAPAGKEAA